MVLSDQVLLISILEGGKNILTKSLLKRDLFKIFNIDYFLEELI